MKFGFLLCHGSHTPTLSHPPSNTHTDDFRVFVGDLGNEVSDEALFRAFSKYQSIQNARIVRDKTSSKSKGYGFVSFKDPQDFLGALKDMNGEWVVCEVFART